MVQLRRIQLKIITRATVNQRLFDIEGAYRKFNRIHLIRKSEIVLLSNKMFQLSFLFWCICNIFFILSPWNRSFAYDYFCKYRQIDSKLRAKVIKINHYHRLRSTYYNTNYVIFYVHICLIFVLNHYTYQRMVQLRSICTRNTISSGLKNV